jgi:hypothetical protein
MFVGHRVPVEEARYNRTVAVDIDRSVLPHGAGGAWVPSSEHESAADVYPSAESAAVALTRQLARVGA